MPHVLAPIQNFRVCSNIVEKVNSDQIGQQTVSQLQGVRVNPRFEKLASMPLPPEFCGANAQSQIDLLYSITHSQHINIRWQDIADAIANDELTEWRGSNCLQQSPSLELYGTEVDSAYTQNFERREFLGGRK